MHLDVLTCGPACTVQDAGRFGFRRYGVSTAGAMDRAGMAVANALAGNAPDTAALEIALTGAAFRIEGGDALVALGGVEATLTVAGRAVPFGQSTLAADGDEIRIGPARGGIYTYLAVGGGLDTPEAMGSRSVHRRTGIGGVALAMGDKLPLAGTVPRPPRRLLQTSPEADRGRPIRLMAGPQAEYFTPQVFETLLGATFRVDARSDRMAYRLDGPTLAHSDGYNIVSDGVLPGSIQVPGDGRPLVLMRDCQTTGGYPKIATVISADLDRLAQTLPGEALTFRLVERDEAVAAARRLAAWIDGLSAATRPITGVPSSAELLSRNLIGGVIDGRDDPTIR